MAPLPQSTPSPSPSPSPSPQPPSVLPGLKRGIAVGVASSICIILISLLAFLVLRRRKQRKTRPLPSSPSAKELPAFQDDNSAPPLAEKHWSSPLPPPPPPIEADTRTIYELAADPVPELPTKAHVSSAQELDGKVAEARPSDPQPRNVARGEGGVQANDASTARYRDVPTLHISPPEMSPLSSASLLLGVSPLSVSPLEDAYFPQSPRSPRSPQNWI